MNLSCSPAVISSRSAASSSGIINIIQPYGSIQGTHPWFWRQDAHHQHAVHQRVQQQQVDEGAHHQRLVREDGHHSTTHGQDVHTRTDDRDGHQDTVHPGSLDSDIQEDHTVPLLHDEDPDYKSNDVLIRSRPHAGRIRLIRTLSMLLFYICLGLNAGIMSPAALDLMDLYHCNVAQISMVFMVKALGIVLGSFSGGAISNRFRRKADVLLAGIIIVFGLTNAALPWCSGPLVAGVLMGAIGLMHGTINVVCSSVTIAEWGEKAPAPVNAIHFALTLGMLLAPPTTAPFLSKRDQNITMNIPYNQTADADTVTNSHSLDVIMSPADSNSYGYVMPIGMHVYNHEPDELKDSISVHTESKIFIPFAFHGALGVCTGLLFLCYYCAGWEYQSAKRFDSSTTTSNLSNGVHEERKFKILMGIALFLTYVCIVNSNNTINVFIFYVAVKSSIHMPKSRAAIFNTVYNGSWVIGRLLGTLNARCIKIHYIVFFSILAVLANTILLVFFGLRTEMTFWLLTCAMGIFSGPCYPSVMAWANRYIEMEGVMVAIIDIGIGIGGFVSLYLGGHLLHTQGAKGPVYIFIMSAAASGMLLITVTTLQIYCYIRGDRFKRQTSLS